VIEAAGGDGPLTLVGHSMGGMALLQLCAMHPQLLGARVSALVLVDTSSCDVIGGMLPGAARAARPALRLVEEAALRAAAANPDAFDRIRKARRDLVSLMVRLMGFGPKAPAAELAFVGHLLEQTPPEVLVYVLQTLRFMDCTAGLEEIDVPTLVVCGSRDRLTPPTASLAIANAIHTAELAVIRGAGHMPMLEKPDRFNALLRAFLAHPGAALSGRRIGSR
jgi:pimeloyl-ACP methyl ester carboxylesterase